MNLEALKELAAKIEAGDDVNALVHLVENFDEFEDKWEHAGRVINNGSLDAAKALHDAVLPGWIVSEIRQDQEGWKVVLTKWEDAARKRHYATAIDFDLSRAWLLAIFRAIIAQEESK